MGQKVSPMPGVFTTQSSRKNAKCQYEPASKGDMPVPLKNQGPRGIQSRFQEGKWVGERSPASLETIAPDSSHKNCRKTMSHKRRQVTVTENIAANRV